MDGGSTRLPYTSSSLPQNTGSFYRHCGGFSSSSYLTSREAMFETHFSLSPRPPLLAESNMSASRLVHLDTRVPRLVHTIDSARKRLFIAVEARLVPAFITWNTWLHIYRSIRQACDQNRLQRSYLVDRWDQGELRVNRINWIMRLVRGRFFRRWIVVERGYTPFFTPFFASLAVLFATFSVILSSFQVAVTYREAPEMVGTAGYWFAISCLISVVVVVAITLVSFIARVLNNVFVATRSKYQTSETSILGLEWHGVLFSSI